MRATNYKHYGSGHSTKVKSAKPHKKAKAITLTLAVAAVVATLILPTTTLAPDVDAYEDSKIASYSVGDISEFSSVIKDNCIELTTAPQTQVATTVAEESKKSTETTKPAEEETTKAETKSTEASSEAETKATTEVKTEEEPAESETEETTYTSSNSSNSYSGSSSYLINISNPDTSYSPSYVSLSSYDRAKLERLVMGEAGTMGYNGCALVAQAIRDAMNRSNTSSIDQIISEYQYYGSTSIDPNSDVKNAVSYIFDQNGSAVQHRILCFYTGQSDWHETQTFVVGCGSVRFFDLTY